MPGTVEEEEGLSSTPEKEDAEDGRAVSTVQVMYSSIKQLEAPATVDVPSELVEAPSRNESLIMIEESVPEEDVGDLGALGPVEEAQTIHPSVASDQMPAFMKALNDSSPYYERLRKRRPSSTTATPLTCEGHPFFDVFLINLCCEVLKS